MLPKLLVVSHVLLSMTHDENPPLRRFIRSELLTVDVDTHFALGHNQHFTCTFSSFTSSRLKSCLYFHFEDINFPSGLDVAAAHLHLLVCVCVCVCVCGCCVYVWFVCKLNTASDWLTNFYTTLANHHHLCCCLAPPSSESRVGWQQLQFITCVTVSVL